MSAKLARRAGLVHEIAKDRKLDEAVEHQISMLLRGGPEALRESKEPIFTIAHRGESASQALKRRTAEIIAHIRVSGEGQEGLSAFLEKRTPEWLAEPEEAAEA